MDEITEKRIERDVEHIGDLAKRSATMIDLEMGDMSALNAEMEKHLPQWASPLMTMPSAIITYAMSVFVKIGAPPNYLIRLLEASLDETLPRLWPQPGRREVPAWHASDVNDCPECGRAGHAEMASQCIRLVLLAYEEIRDVIAEEHPKETDEDWRRRAVAAITFMVSAFGSLMVA